LKFGESSSKLKTNVTKPNPFKIEAKVKEFTTLIADLEKKCKTANDMTKKRLEKEIDIAQVSLGIYTTLKGQ
jgi:hypothetical protein